MGAGAWLAAACLALAQNPAADIVTLRQLKTLTPAQAAAGPSVRIKGTVVCYDAGWHQLYIHDGRETLYFNADDFAAQPRKGQLVEITGRARGTNVLENGALAVLGPGPLPPRQTPRIVRPRPRARRMGANLRAASFPPKPAADASPCSSTTKAKTALVYVLGSATTNDFRSWLNARVQTRGINASRAAAGRLESALVFVPGADEIKVLDPSGPPASQTPVTSIGSLLNRELGSWTNHWVHINGLVVSYQPGASLVVKDPTGVISARVIQLTEIRGDERVDVWGFLEAGPDETVLNQAYFEVAHPPPADLTAVPPAAPLSKVAPPPRRPHPGLRHP